MTRVLIVAPSWIGDMVMTQSVVAALKQSEPDAQVDLLAPAWSAQLAPRMPGVDRTHTIDLAHGRFGLVRRIRFGRSLRANGYDRAIVLPNSWKSAIVPWAAGIPARIGTRGEMRYGLLSDPRPLDKAKLPRTIDRYVALVGERGSAAREIPMPVLRHDALHGRSLADKLGLPREGKVIALCPGAEFGPSKQWPAKHFAALADMLAGRGFRLWILGGPKDADIGETIRGLAKSPQAIANLAGKTDIGEAIDLISLTAGVVANDSGLMHIAAAVGRPLVALYGATTSAANPPLTDRATVLERTLPCRPCGERVCPLGHLNCLNLISPAEVAEAMLARAEAA